MLLLVEGHGLAVEFNPHNLGADRLDAAHARREDVGDGVAVVDLRHESYAVQSHLWFLPTGQSRPAGLGADLEPSPEGRNQVPSMRMVRAASMASTQIRRAAIRRSRACSGESVAILEMPRT